MLITEESSFRPNKHVQSWLLQCQEGEGGSEAFEVDNDQYLSQDIPYVVSGQFKAWATRYKQVLTIPRSPIGGKTKTHERRRVECKHVTKLSIRTSSREEGGTNNDDGHKRLGESQEKLLLARRSKRKRKYSDKFSPIRRSKYLQSQKQQPNRIKPINLRNYDAYSQSSSLSSSNVFKIEQQYKGDIINEKPVDPVEKYAKRPRHKTREDRYEFKGDKNNHKTKKKNDEQTINKKIVKRRKTGITLKENFKAPNVDSERLTLGRSLGPGFLGKGRSSASVAHRDIPDLTFPNMTFSRKYNKVDEARFGGDYSDLHKEEGTNCVNPEISEYFSRVKPRMDTQKPTISTKDAQPGEHHASSPRKIRDYIEYVNTHCQPLSETTKSHDKSQANKWKSNPVVPEVLQFYPTSSRRGTSSYGTQNSPVSWSTSPSHRPHALINQDRPTCKDGVPVWKLDNKNLLSDILPLHQEQSVKEALRPSRDSSIHQYTRDALIGKQPGLWQNISPESVTNRNMSLDELKRLAQQVHISYDTVDKYNVDDHGNLDLQPTNSVLGGILVSNIDPHYSQGYDPSEAGAGQHILPDYSGSGRSFGLQANNHSNNRHSSKQTRDLQIRPSSIQHGANLRNDDNRNLTSAFLADRRNVPDFPRLAPLEAEISNKKCTIDNDHGHTCNQNCEHTSTPSYGQRDQLTYKDGFSPDLAGDWQHQKNADVSSSQNFNQLFHEHANEFDSGSTYLDRFDLELLSMHSFRTLRKESENGWNDSKSANASKIISPISALRSISDIECHRNHVLGPQQRNMLNEGTRCIDVKRWALSPNMQPFSRFSRPYLLF